ncbi:hypothetical protein [Methylomonas sp. CM2]|uniref:hypothetical protein n=1 Tax=Methylomonas sp. CM2 TaxID=3417647 RepID=UPI003CFB2D53
MSEAKAEYDKSIEDQSNIEKQLENAKTIYKKSKTGENKNNLDKAQADKDSADLKVNTKKFDLDQAKATLLSSKKNVYGSTLNLLLERNAIQNKIIAASNQRCNAYLNYLQISYSDTNFMLGFLTTAAGGAGSIVSGAMAARALSGAAAVLSGTQAEVNQDYFYNQTVNIILTGITDARKSIINEIEGDAGRGVDGGTNYLAYPIEKAIADAIRYHGACTIAKGVEHVSKIMNYEIGFEQYKKRLDALTPK